MNGDYKIITKIMSNRPNHVLPNINSDSQTCCNFGKDIADTWVSIRDIIDKFVLLDFVLLTEIDEIEGYLVKIDQEKAFDRVSH